VVDQQRCVARQHHAGEIEHLAARLAPDEYLVLDCGTGARLLGKEIAKRREL
jgi:sarcosine oxidase gamma subunit